MEKKIIVAIWRAVNSHFIVTNPVTLSANLKYENNQTVAQAMAIGLSNQYHINREEVETILCIEPSGYDNKLQMFKELTKLSNTTTTPTALDWKRRLGMCSRSVRRALTSSYKA